MSKRKWAPYGVGVPGPGLNPSSQEQIETILVSAKLSSGRLPSDRIAAFLNEADLAVGTYHAGRSMRQRTLPATVRKNLDRALDATKTLREALNGLDDLSRHLITQGQPEALETVWSDFLKINEVLRKARRRAAALPSTRGRFIDYERQHLAAHIAWAIREHLGLEPTRKKNGLYEQVLATVIEDVDRSKGATGRRMKRQGPDVRDLMHKGLATPVHKAPDGVTTIGPPVD